jgi:hypothetical protein
LKINYIETLFDHRYREAEIRAQTPVDAFKERDLLSSAHGLRGEKTAHLESTRIPKSTSFGTHPCEASIQKVYEGCADTAWSRY